MKAQSKSRGIALLFLKIGARWGLVFSAISFTLPLGKTRIHPIERDRGGTVVKVLRYKS